MLVVIAAASVAILTVLISSSQIDKEARATAADSNAAVQAARIQDTLAQPSLLMANGYVMLIFSRSFATLTPEQQQDVRAQITNTFQRAPLGPARARQALLTR